MTVVLTKRQEQNGQRRLAKFRTKHRSLLPKDFYAVDGDLFLLDQMGRPFALLDVKGARTPLSWAEEKLYGWCLRQKLKVFIVVMRGAKVGGFGVYEWDGLGLGERRVSSGETWRDYFEWEMGARRLSEAEQLQARARAGEFADEPVGWTS